MPLRTTARRMPARIPVPTFPTATTSGLDESGIGPHSTYPEILQTYTPIDISDTDTSVQEYDEWMKSLSKDKKGLEEKVTISPSTIKLVKLHARKAKKAAKEDKFELFKNGRDVPLLPFHQRRIRIIESQRLMKADPKKKKKGKQRGPTKLSQLLEGEYACLEPVEVTPIENQKVDIDEALDLRPVLSPEQAKSIQAMVKGQKSRLKPYLKRYSTGILEDPIWERWHEEDRQNLKRGVSRMKPPLIPKHLPPAYGPVSLDEVYQMVDVTTRLPRPDLKHRYGELGGIVPDGLDPLSMEILHHMVPVPKTKLESRCRLEPQKRPPILSRLEMHQIDMERQAMYDEHTARQRTDHARPRSSRFPVPTIPGVYDQTLRSYPDFLMDDTTHDPWLEKIRGIGALTATLDWDSVFINRPERYHIQAAGCDTAEHRLRYGSPSLRPLKPVRTIGEARRSRSIPRQIDVESLENAQTHRPNGSNRSKRKYSPEPAPHVIPPAIDPRLDMPALRDIVLIPEAKIDHKRIRTAEPMTSAREVTDFFTDLYPEKASIPALQTKKVPPQTKVVPKEIPQFDWRKHKSIQNPKWYASSIRLSATREKEPIPTFIANSVLQIRPLFRALEGVNFNPVEINTPHIQHVDMILSPTTGAIFTSLAKLPSNREKLMDQIKSAAFYFSRVLIVLEVVPYRLFKDPKAAAECKPIDEDIVKGLSTFKRALEVSVNTKEGKEAEVVYALNGAEEVATMLRGITLKLDSQLLKTCHSDTLALLQDKAWIHKEVDEREKEFLIAAGFNLYSTHLILRLCGSFMGFAEGMTQKERLDKVAPVVGQKFVTRFNAKWWRRQMEGMKLQIEPATSETLHSG